MPAPLNPWEYEPLAVYQQRRAQEIRQSTQALGPLMERTSQAKLARDAAAAPAIREDLEVRTGKLALDATLKEAAEAKTSNFLFKALEIISRPQKAVRNLIEELAFDVPEFDSPGGAFLAGLQGKGQRNTSELMTRHADVLKSRWGLKDVEFDLPGPLRNVSLFDVLGLGADLTVDPLLPLTMGPGGGLVAKGIGAGFKAGAGLPSKFVVEGAQSLDDVAKITGVAAERIAQANKLAEGVALTGRVLDIPQNPLIPVVGHAARGVQRQIKELFRPGTDLESLNFITEAGDVVKGKELVAETTRTQRVALMRAQKAWKEKVEIDGKLVENPLKKLYEKSPQNARAFAQLFARGGEDAKAFQDAILQGLNLTDGGNAQLAALWQKALKSPMAPEETATIINATRYYLGHWEPVGKGLAEELGLTSFLGIYMRRIYGASKKDASEVMRSGRGLGYLTFMKKRTLADPPVEELIGRGMLDDLKLVLTFDRAEREAALLFRDQRTFLGQRFGFRVNAENIASVPDGWKVLSSHDWNLRTAAEARDALEARTAQGLAKGLGEQLADQPGAQKTLAVLQENIPHGLKKGEEFYAIPDNLARALDRAFSPKVVPEFLRNVDALQAIWKGMVTGIFPAFHIRNLIGNVWNSWLHGGFDTQHWALALGAQRGTVTKFMGQTIDEITEQMAKRGAWGSGRHSYAELRNTALGGAERDLNPLEKVAYGEGPVAKLFEKGRSVGEWLENTSRLGHVMARRSKGDTLEAAIQSAKDAMYVYDYSSPFMESVVTRAFPFARWFTQNVWGQLERLFAQPAKFMAIEKGRQFLTQRDYTDAEIALLPEWFFEQMGGLIDATEDEKGNTVLNVAVASGLPAEDLNLLYLRTPKETIKEVLGLSGPVMRALMEPVFGSFFTKRQIDDPSFDNYYRRMLPLIDKVPGLADKLGFKQREITDGKGNQKMVWYSEAPHLVWFLNLAFGRLIATGLRASDDRIGAWQKALNLSTGVFTTERQLARPLDRGGLHLDRAYAETGADLAQYVAWHEEGRISGDAYSANRERILGHHFNELQKIRDIELGQDYRIDPTDGKQIEQKRAILDFARENMLGPEAIAIERYYQAKPQDFVDKAGNISWDGYFAEKDAAVEAIREIGGDELVKRVQTAWMRKFPKEVRDHELERDQAELLWRQYRDLSTKMGVDPETNKRVKAVNRAVGNIAEFMPQGQAGNLRRAQQLYVEQTGDAEGLALARQVARRRKNPARTRFFNQHAELFRKWFGEEARREVMQEDFTQAVETLDALAP